MLTQMRLLRTSGPVPGKTGTAARATRVIAMRPMRPTPGKEESVDRDRVSARVQGPRSATDAKRLAGQLRVNNNR